MLQPGHLQNIIDEAQEVPAGAVDLIQVSRRLLRVLQVPPGQFAGTKDRVERGAHIVGHAAKERLLGVLVLPGHLQGLLQQLTLPHLPLFLLLHLPEAEDHLLRRQRFVKEDPHADPAVFRAKPAQEFSAEVPDPLPDQLPDIFAGEALHKVPEGVRLDDLPGGTEQISVGPCGRDPLPDISGALDHLIGFPLIVHPVQGVVGIPQHLCGLIGPPGAGLQAVLAESQCRHDQEREAEHEEQRP